jgi:hypothetical protein
MAQVELQRICPVLMDTAWKGAAQARPRRGVTVLMRTLHGVSALPFPGALQTVAARTSGVAVSAATTR